MTLARGQQPARQRRTRAGVGEGRERAEREQLQGTRMAFENR